LQDLDAGLLVSNETAEPDPIKNRKYDQTKLAKLSTSFRIPSEN
jgi:hypothetical protein